mmetsp:Transcript_62217/g.86515  ORF Transcript_62217/g.86515 Transcript_62217/m.86515 type:complete len:174 (+) Transcript_62217:11-532(+)
MKQVQTLLFVVVLALACVHVCQAGFPFGGTAPEAECSAASVMGLEQCPGTDGEAIQIRNVAFVPSTLTIGSEVTVSGEMSVRSALTKVYLQIYIENSPIRGPFNEFSVDVCSEAEMRGEDLCPIPPTDGYVAFSNPVTVPGFPLIPGHYCGNITALDVNMQAVGCALFNVQLN